MGINMSKVCIKCKQTKSTVDYSKSKLYKDGLQNQCKYCKNIQSKQWRENNSNYQKQYLNNNKEYFKKYLSKYNKDLRQDPTEKIKHHLRVYIGQTIKEIGAIKQKKSLNVVGLESWDKLREHIESQWTDGMNWDNHGVGKDNTTWHIDHIIPISSAKTEEDVYKLNYYTNLRPMWGSDNIKKSNKIF